MDKNSVNEIIEPEDDFDVYFLKPVNEYNIVEKIKAANKELFSCSVCLGPEAEISVKSVTLQTNRKVSFAINLEEYEPPMKATTIMTKINCNYDANDFKHKFERNLENVEEEEEIEEEECYKEIEAREGEKNIQQLKQTLKSIEIEELPDNDIDNFKEITKDDVKEDFLIQNPEDDILEEICKDVCVLDKEEKIVNVVSDVSNCSCVSSPLKMLKQIKLDYSYNESIQKICYNKSAQKNIDNNESCGNSLLCDNKKETASQENTEEKIDKLHRPKIMPISWNATDGENQDLPNSENVLTLTESNHNKVNDADYKIDQLSVLVAPYISDDDYKNTDKVTLIPGKCLDNYNSNSNLNKKENSKKGRNVLLVNVSPLTKIQKKNLPKYTGYISEYGLSREQLMEREKKIQKKKSLLLQQALKASEEELRKMQDNERAFVRWLRNKMRFPVNKTRNMFDVKCPFGVKHSTKLSTKILKYESQTVTQEKKKSIPNNKNAISCNNKKGKN